MRTFLIALWAYIHQLYIDEQGLKMQTIATLFRRTLSAWFALNLCFYLIEVAIWGHGFPHTGDIILIAILAIEFVASVTIVCHLHRSREPKLKKMSA
ncbi:hypothetical protein ACPV5U_19350 [Vibrio mediterranei]